MNDRRIQDKDPPVDGMTKPLKTASFVLRMNPDEKADLEQKVRVAAAKGKRPLSLAEALRMGAVKAAGKVTP